MIRRPLAALLALEALLAPLACAREAPPPPEAGEATVSIAPEEIGWWTEQAAWDLAMAEKNLAVQGYAVTVFLAQQSAEKYLKALYVQDRGKAPPMTHDLVRLGRAVGLPPRFLAEGKRLYADYTRCRYPDAARGVPYKVCGREVAEARLAAARRIADYVRGQMAVAAGGAP